MKKPVIVLLALFTFLFSKTEAQKIYYLSDLDNIRGQFIIPGDKEPYTGLAVEEHPNRQRSLEAPIKNGKMDGVVKEWSIEGVLTSETKYSNGLKNGLEKQFHDSGKKKLEVNNINGLAEGKCMEWHPNGKLKSEGNYKNGKEDGLHVWWFDNDLKDQQMTYNNGLLEGKFQNWHRNGQLRLEANYLNGKKEGKSTEWYENGQMKMQGNYSNDKLNGATESYSKTGQLLGIQTFENGKLVKDVNYRSGSIELKEGYLEIFNKPDMAITIALTGSYVIPKKAEVPTYNVEGNVIQLIITALDSLKTNEKDVDKLLTMYQLYEQSYIEKFTKSKIIVEGVNEKTKTGMPYRYWSFKSPESNEVLPKNARKVVMEHYLSVICGTNILSIYCPSISLDKPEDTAKLMKKLADSITIHPPKLDISALSNQIKQTLTWPGK